MKKIRIVLVGLAVTIGFCSCRSTTLLTTSFQGEVIGSLPAKNIPGAPSGDFIEYAEEIEPKIRIAASDRAGEKVLHFTNVGFENNYEDMPALEFRGIPTSFERRVWFIYTGQHSGTSGTILLSITDGYGKEIARAGIGPGGDLALVSTGSSGSEIIGTIPPGESHTVIFSVDMSEGTYHVTIFKRSGTIVSDNHPLLNPIPSYRNPATPTMTWNFQWFHGSEDRQYLLKTVLISRKEPDMR